MELTHGDTTVHHQPFHLGELMGVGGIIIIPSVYFSGTDDLDRNPSLPGFHGAYLNRGGLGPQQDLRCDVKGILHIPGRMVFGKVEGLKIIIICLHFRTLRHFKAHSDKDIFDALNHRVQRMQPPKGFGFPGRVTSIVSDASRCFNLS